MPEKQDETEERVFVSTEKALSMVSKDEHIHTFRSPAVGMLIGSDMHRETLIEKMDKFKVELSGEFATNMNHGLVLLDASGPLFIETLKEGNRDRDRETGR